jgi:hypothetical protein
VLHTHISLEHLRRYRLPTTYAQSVTYLRWRRETAQLLTIYQRYFPDDFPDQWKLDQETLLPVSTGTYSESELVCLKLIEARLFPFALDHLLECCQEGERLSTIPLWSFGIDRWNQPLQDFSPGWQLLLLLIEEIEDELDLDAEVLDVLQQLERSPRRLSLSQLETLCQQVEAPLAYLPVALRMLDHCTENAFLDPTDEMPCEDLYWELADIELLAEHWREAEVMMQQAEQLTEWLATEPSRLRKVIALWNTALS